MTAKAGRRSPVIRRASRVERGKSLSDESKVMLWKPHIAASLDALKSENKTTERSLGIIQPDSGSLKFFWPAAEAQEKEEARECRLRSSSNRCSRSIRPSFVFGYKYTSGGTPHTHTTEDWEVQAAYIAYQRRYGTRDETLKMLEQEYGIPDASFSLAALSVKRASARSETYR